MRGDDLPPRLQPALRFALRGDEGRFPHLLAALLIELDAEQIHPHLLDFRRFGRGNGRQQTPHAVQGAVGIAAGESLLVCPFVPHVAKFADDAPLGGTQRAVEDRVPLVPHDRQQGLRVPVELRGLLALPTLRWLAFAGDFFPLGPVDCLQFPFHKGH